MRTARTLIAMLALILIVGCQTPLDRLATAERTYAATAEAFRPVVRSGAIKGKALDALQVANNEANDTLKDANAKANAGQTPDELFFIDRAISAVTRFAHLFAQKKDAP